MLASTVKFSRYGRKTGTRHPKGQQAADPQEGAAKKLQPTPQDPTVCLTSPPPHQRSTPQAKPGIVLASMADESASKVNVPHSGACPADNERAGTEQYWTTTLTRSCQRLLRKEVIQPHLPVRLPCYDLVLITSPTFDGSLPQGVRPPASGVTDFHDLTGGVYKPRERIHRSVADLRLLATPTSWGRVADPNPN